MNTVKIKLCGITNIDDAKLIVDLDFDYIGLIFVDASPRCLSLSTATQIYNICKDRKKIIGVFQNQRTNFLENIIKNIEFDFLQFHGNESATLCESFNIPYIKTISINPDGNLSQDIQNYQSSFALLLDTKINNKTGGTGKVFDWKMLHDNDEFKDFIKTKPYFISGGLNLLNIADLIKNYKPWGIDISSGVESMIGKKDITLVKKFLENVKIAENFNEKN
tara:strand:+ start:14773 stop:15435 length:663 start_codon:yes stop_codon:yes gene_type:complete